MASVQVVKKKPEAPVNDGIDGLFFYSHQTIRLPIGVPTVGLGVPYTRIYVRLCSVA